MHARSWLSTVPNQLPNPMYSDILFIINGAAAVHERSLRQHRTWCSTPRTRCIFLTDEAYEHESGMHVLTVAVESSERVHCAGLDEQEVAYQAAQYRFLRGLSLVFRQALADWVVLVDDDSFVLPASLRLLLGGLDHRQPVYLGEFANRGTASWACGGGGFAFSWAAMATMDLDACAQRHKALPRIGCDGALARPTAELLSNDFLVLLCARKHGVAPVRNFSCGTCGNQDGHSHNFTLERLASGSCAFMQNQASFAPHNLLPYMLANLRATMEAQRSVPSSLMFLNGGAGAALSAATSRSRRRSRRSASRPRAERSASQPGLAIVHRLYELVAAAPRQSEALWTSVGCERPNLSTRAPSPPPLL